jgi:AraC-like DNA-binding protein
MGDDLLTWYQALQLLALGPSIFMLFFICVAVRKLSQLVVPALYFLSLIASFILPLLDIFQPNDQILCAFHIAESLAPSLSFLLIIQFIYGRIPSISYWSILAIPLVGGSSLIYATLIIQGDVCVYDQICANPVTIKTLYEIFSASLTFLLTVIIFHRQGVSKQDQNKYAIVVALVLLNLLLLTVNLLEVSNTVTADRAALAITIIRIGFVYLILTSVFRVFDRSFAFAYDRIPHMRPKLPSPQEKEIADKIRTLLTEEKIYREMELSRIKLAKRLSITEHQLSRIISKCFPGNLSTLINNYRVAEAQERLINEETSITIIAFEVGFNSIPSFNRVFKSEVGMSPTEYRKTQFYIQK